MAGDQPRTSVCNVLVIGAGAAGLRAAVAAHQAGSGGDRRVPPLPTELAAWAQAATDLPVTDRLLE